MNVTTTVLNLYKIKLFNFDLLLYCHFEFVAVWRVINSAKLHFVFLNPISAGRNRVNPIPIDIGVPPPPMILPLELRKGSVIHVPSQTWPAH